MSFSVPISDVLFHVKKFFLFFYALSGVKKYVFLDVTFFNWGVLICILCKDLILKDDAALKIPLRRSLDISWPGIKERNWSTIQLQLASIRWMITMRLHSALLRRAVTTKSVDLHYARFAVDPTVYITKSDVDQRDKMFVIC